MFASHKAGIPEDPDVIVLAIADAVRKMLAVTSSSW